MSRAQVVREKRNETFNKIVEGLNPDQRKAVENINGPMLVAAGPGTGKTHMVAARIGSILQQAAVDASNILCLTYTNAGVTAMRQRLLKFLGPEAHRVHIYTFHSFCDSIIREYPESFGQQDMEPISELDQLRLIEEILNELPYDNPIVKGKLDPSWFASGLKSLFGTIKQEGWSEKEMLDAITRWEKDIPLTEGFFYKTDRGKGNKGEINPKGKTELRKMERLRAGIACFSVYEKKMRSAGFYEYADMINWVVDAFKTNDELLGFYQEKFQYILVDEYQDTNGSQHDLLRELTSYWESPNLFVVGDDDQSIYEFQGARLENIKDFYLEHERDIDLVVLSENYRSSKLILDVSKELINKNEKRLIHILPKVTKDLVASNPNVANFPKPPMIVSYENPLDEIVDIVYQIEQLKNQGVPLKEIAVIYAKNKQSIDLQELLLRREIPFQISRPINILETPIIQQIEKFLFYIDTEFHNPASGDYHLFWIMHFKCWGLSRRDLSSLAVHRSRFARDERPSLFSLFQKSSEDLKEIGVKDPESMIQFFQKLEDLIQDLANLPLIVLIEKVLHSSGMVEQALRENNGFEQLQILQTFKQFVRKRVRREPDLNIDRLLLLLNDHRKNNIAIPLSQIAEGGDKVYLTTSHSAKGLEFDHVFMLNCTSNNWKRGGSRNSFSFPPTLTFSSKEDENESARRLFFVSMTRAKRFLHISYSRKSEEGRDRSPTTYLSEVMEIMGMDEAKHCEVEKTVGEEYLNSLMVVPMGVKIEQLPKETINHLLRDFKLSFSALNSYQRCPLSFFYDHVLKVPGVSSPAASYGTAMHRALFHMYEPLNEKGSTLSKESVVEVFDREMEKMRGFFEDHIYRSRLEMGKEYLGMFHDQYSTQLPKKVQLEHPIYTVEVDGVPLGGDIDRVDIVSPYEVYLFDYKSGKPNMDRLKVPDEVNQYGGDYWKQLQFYKILFNAKYPDISVRKASIMYLRPGTNLDVLEEKSVELLESYSAEVRDWIKEAYDNIQAHKFYNGCGEADCHWCEFSRQVGFNT